MGSGSLSSNVPEKIASRAFRNLRWTLFTPYRRLWVVAVVVNLTAFLAMSISPKSRGRLLTYSNTTSATSVNLALAVILRQEHVVNALFLTACKIPLCAPLRLRRFCAKIYTYGGLHSGCALSATFWFIASTVLIGRDSFMQPHGTPATGAVAIIITLLLLSMTCTAHPGFRAKYHDWFEGVHRFCGWTAVALFWTETMLLTHVETQRTQTRFSLNLRRSPSFWCLISITICIVLPWLRVRKLTVRPERLSDHAIRLHFEGQKAIFGQGFRLADSPLIENHAFAAIADPNGSKSFSVIVSNAGDWTKRMIDNPPKWLWTRGVLQYGAIRVATLFQPVVVVATGSGIAPCLSLFTGAPQTRCHVLWSAPRPLETFGQPVLDMVLKKDADATIIDTRKLGRPDLVREAYQIYSAVGAEAVIVISNAAVTRKVVYGLESRGVPAFAPVFDS